MRALVRVALTSLIVGPAALTLACDDGRVTQLEADLADQREAVAAAQVRADEQTRRAAEAAAKLTEQAAEKDAEIDRLEAEVEAKAASITALEQTKGGLESELEHKEAALEAVKTLQDALSKSLVEEIETGDVRVAQRDGLLVVDVADTVLFGVGEAELSERGEQVLDRLSKSLIALPNEAVFQVGGHTDNQPIKSEAVKAEYPTNWELSAARATNVVRYLEDTAGIPGERLIAAGFAEYRPIATNANAKGRAKNRRIEIALLPRA